MQELNLKAALALLRRSGATFAFQPGSVEYLQEVVDGLVALSAVDPLTGLPNRRRLDEELVRHAKLTRRGRMVSLLAVDIDDFKSVNDRHGHSVGDKVLKTAARSLQAAVRDSDILMRIGGEEFAVILPDADIDTARNAAERIRKAFSQTFFGEGIGRLTVSIGIATMQRGESPEGCLVRADTCLYAAKRNGRDRIVADSGESASEEAVEA